MNYAKKIWFPFSLFDYLFNMDFVNSMLKKYIPGVKISSPMRTNGIGETSISDPDNKENIFANKQDNVKNIDTQLSESDRKIKEESFSLGLDDSSNNSVEFNPPVSIKKKALQTTDQVLNSNEEVNHRQCTELEENELCENTTFYYSAEAATYDIDKHLGEKSPEIENSVELSQRNSVENDIISENNTLDKSYENVNNIRENSKSLKNSLDFLNNTNPINSQSLDLNSTTGVFDKNLTHSNNCSSSNNCSPKLVFDSEQFEPPVAQLIKFNDTADSPGSLSTKSSCIQELPSVFYDKTFSYEGEIDNPGGELIKFDTTGELNKDYSVDNKQNNTITFNKSFVDSNQTLTQIEADSLEDLNAALDHEEFVLARLDSEIPVAVTQEENYIATESVEPKVIEPRFAESIKLKTPENFKNQSLSGELLKIVETTDTLSAKPFEVINQLIHPESEVSNNTSTESINVAAKDSEQVALQVNAEVENCESEKKTDSISKAVPESAKYDSSLPFEHSLVEKNTENLNLTSSATGQCKKSPLKILAESCSPNNSFCEHNLNCQEQIAHNLSCESNDCESKNTKSDVLNSTVIVESTVKNEGANKNDFNLNNTIVLCAKKSPEKFMETAPIKLVSHIEVNNPKDTDIDRNQENLKNHIPESIPKELKKMAELNDKLQQEYSDLKLQLNACQQAKASLELEISKKDEIVLKTQAESLKKEQSFQQEIKALKEQLKEKNNLIEKGSLKELEEALKESKAQALSELNARISEEQNYRKIMEEYEKSIAARVRDCLKLKEENDTAARHLANLELSFSDVHQKYERAKVVIDGFKTNEETLKQNIALFEDTIHKQEEKYESLRAHAKAQIERSNKENIILREKYEAEINKLAAIIKRLEIKTAALENNLEQKTKECQALSALCDEVTGKRV